ncbi:MULTISPECIES: hypothetical protein [unclassified Streptomyces]|uniref:hypothetical protein n=1 Tax=unclassified Streptomyces TaxID=2593676 RepID=UPI0036EC5DAF
MAAKTDHLTSLRAARQLRRIRGFYAMAVLLWAVAATWTAWTHPGTRQMWVSMGLLALFAGLLCTATLWLRSLRSTTARGPAHHAAPRRTASPRHASA